jgi:hypothetical protein
MGSFFIKPLPNERYQAICHNGERTLRFDLPEAQSNTIALKSHRFRHLCFSFGDQSYYIVDKRFPNRQ